MTQSANIYGPGRLLDFWRRCESAGVREEEVEVTGLSFIPTPCPI
jgi:hypothetical protein